LSREQRSNEEQQAINDWLKAGNKITICPTGQTSDGELPGYAWGKKKKKSQTAKKKTKLVK
tara:strand:- start:577 stop:759 length:183 start_codon:yes stop_codon:yes gene_type:complete